MTSPVFDAGAAGLFRLARMSPFPAVLTALLLCLPAGLAVAALLGVRVLAVPAVLLVVVYLWVWLRARPRGFRVQGDQIDVVWPLKRRRISRQAVSDVRIVDRHQLKSEIGWGVRIGVGGLWGTFGLLWTRRRGILRIYASRTDRIVWIATRDGSPWLITPENPDVFVAALADRRDAG